MANSTLPRWPALRQPPQASWHSAAAALASAFRFARPLALPLTLGLFGLLPNAAVAEDYPVRPVRLIVGFGPGASGDVAARMIAQPLGRLLGQQFVVENRTGAGSNIATNFVAHAPKDGYTLLLGTVGNTINASYANLSFDFVADLAPIVMLATQPNILVVHPSTGVKTVEELIRLARAKPEQLSFPSGGVGSGSHFSGELFNVMAGTKLVHVPYAGTAQGVTDLLGGRVQVMFSPASSVLQHVQDRKLFALASTQLKRTSAAPELPTVSESGLPGFDTAGWFGLLAPAGTPKDILDRLERATRAAMKTDEFILPMRQQGFDLEDSTPIEFAAFIQKDMAKWARVAVAAGLKR
jgi:tripartite-type tricarboxylate transporter receptor subunit TctC